MEATLPTLILSLEALRRFQELAYDHAGIRIGDHKLGLVQNRLRSRVEACGCSGFDAYYALVKQADQVEERQRCIEALTTNETFFFRHAAHWDYLIQDYLPRWLAAGHSRRLRAWCAAASNGSEPYSLAMVLLTIFSQREAFHIEASDINRHVISRAIAGDFSDYDLQKLSPEARATWFQPVGQNRYRAVDRLRAAVQFNVHNLMQPNAGQAVDMVFLRNVLIYFDEASKRQVLDGIGRRLRRGGLLFLGGSEILPPGIGGYRTVGPAIYEREE